MAREPASSSDITEQELLRRKDFLEFREEDVANLAAINDVARRYADSVIEDFYRHLLSFEETRTRVWSSLSHRVMVRVSPVRAHVCAHGAAPAADHARPK